MPNQVLSTREIRALFAEEISDAGGAVSDVYDDGDWLFARSTLPWIADVRPKDQMQGGVALKATEREVSIHPYLFRLVCRNGAIRAHAIQSLRIEISDMLLPEVASVSLREGVRASCAKEAFTEGVEEVRSATETSLDQALDLLPLLLRMPHPNNPRIIREILSRFFEETDRSRFALMNAVTSVARETRDPALRWRLEELGGGIPVSRPTHPVSPDYVATFLEWEEGADRTSEFLPAERATDVHAESAR